LLDKWPTRSYFYDRLMSSYGYDWPALGICFDIGKINGGKYAMKCWEILWGAVAPPLIAGSLLFEGKTLERDDVYCLGFQNRDARRIELLVSTLEKNAEFLKFCADPGFFSGETVMRQPLVSAGEINAAGSITGISENARLALNKVTREKTAALRTVDVPVKNGPGPVSPTDAAWRGSPSMLQQLRFKKLLDEWKR